MGDGNKQSMICQEVSARRENCESTQEAVHSSLRDKNGYLNLSFCTSQVNNFRCYNKQSLNLNA